MGTGTGKELHVLCYQHHLEMSPEPPELVLYSCKEPGCPVRYDTLTGYFIDPADKEALKHEILPRVYCASEGRPMYLAQAKTKLDRSFRLWRCPECGETRTSEGASGELGKKKRA